MKPHCLFFISIIALNHFLLENTKKIVCSVDSTRLQKHKTEIEQYMSKLKEKISPLKNARDNNDAQL